MKNYFVIVFVVFFMMSCRHEDPSGKNEAGNVNLDSFHSKNIQGETVFEIIAKYCSIDISDSLLFVNTLNKSTGIVEVYTLEGKQITSFGRIGKGPDEFLNGIKMEFDNKRKTYSLYDPNLRKLIEFKYISDLENKVAVIPFRTYDNINQDVSRICNLNETQFITIGFFREGLLGLFLKKDGKPIGYYGNFPITAELKEYNDFQGSLVVNLAKNLVFYAPYSWGYISCYSAGKEIKKQWEHMLTDPVYEIIKGEIIFDNEKHTMGFFDLKVVGNHLYALHYGYNKNKYMNLNILQGAESILVFDFSGTPVIKYTLDTPIMSFCIDKEENTIYGVAMQEEGFNVVKFDL